jgi:hypothetical protein
MSSFTDMANTTTDNASRLKASTKPTKQQQACNQKIVFGDLQFWLNLRKYTNLRGYCHTCPLLFNKYNKYLNYKLNRHYSFLYYSNEAFRTAVLARIHDPLKQLYLDLSARNFTDLTHLEYDITDLTHLEYVHTLNLRFSNNIFDVSLLSRIRILDLSGCDNITDISPLRHVHTLKLCYCPGINVVSSLRNVRNLYLRGCNGVTDISALGNVDILDLSFCNNIRDIRPLSCVRILDLSGCKNIDHHIIREMFGKNIVGYYHAEDPDYIKFRQKYFTFA